MKICDVWLLTLFEVPSIAINTLQPKQTLKDSMIVGTDKGKEQSNTQIFSLIKTESVFKYANDPIILKEFLNISDDAFKDVIKFYIIQQSLSKEKQDAARL